MFERVKELGACGEPGGSLRGRMHGFIEELEMRESCLTDSDRAFLKNFRVWIRASMECQIFNTSSQPYDLVFVKTISPQPPIAGGEFVSLSELVW